MTHSRRGRLAVVAAVAAGLFLVAGPAQALALRAQAGPPGDHPPGFVLLAANALLGGITAGISRGLADDDFLEGFGAGFQGGAAGGAVAFGGRKIASSRTWGAGFTGRQLHALGTSLARNAAAGRGSLDSVVLPVGPLRVDVGKNVPPDRPRVRVSLADVGAAAWAFGTSELTLDRSGSLSAGALVFEAHGRSVAIDGTPIRGATIGGLVLLSGVQDVQGREPYAAARAEAFAHERIHVLQQDFVEALWTGPLERRIAGWVPGGDRAPGWLEGNLLLPAAVILGAAMGNLEGPDAPWEIEADALGGSRAPPDDFEVDPLNPP